VTSSRVSIGKTAQATLVFVSTLIALCVMAWHKTIDGEAFVTILGVLIGGGSSAAAMSHGGRRLGNTTVQHVEAPTPAPPAPAAPAAGPPRP
jgi:hypothetical protein